MFLKLLRVLFKLLGSLFEPLEAILTRLEAKLGCFWVTFWALHFFMFFFWDIWNLSGTQGGCASSRLDHGSKIRAGRLR